MHPSQASRKRWAAALKAAVVLLVLAFVWDTIAEGLDDLDEYPWRLRPAWLAVAGLLYLLGLLPAGLFWHRVLRVLGQDPRLAETLRAYYVGHLGKYVPGKAMVVVIRTGLIRGRQVGAAVAAVSVFLETLTMMAVGALIAGAILAIAFRQQVLLCSVALGLMVLAGLPTLPPVFRRLVHLVGVGKGDPATAERLQRLGYRTLLMGWLAMAAVWVLLGLSLWAVLRAAGSIALGPVVGLPLYTASVALAMVAGFLSLVPGGAVVREAVLAELMVPEFGEALALLSAVLLRLVWLLSELLISGILYIGGACAGRSAKTPD